MPTGDEGTWRLTQLFALAGAVAARMRVHDSGICLVASHLSSGHAEGDELRRNYDYAEVMPCR